jgi:predicted ATPase with chaperone activity
MSQPAAAPLAHRPRTPYLVDGLGIPKALVVDLFVRRVYMEGECTLASLQEALKLSHPVLSDIFHQLRRQKLVEVLGMIGEDYRFVLSEAGRQFAIDRLNISQYAGATPVSLREYTEAVCAQAAAPAVSRERLREVFADLVVTESLLEQLGPALVSQKALFLYGPTGNGKTSLAERLVRIYDDLIAVPYALEVDSQIILVYDPVIHHAVEGGWEELDPRWVVCRRPCVMSGGELVPSMLELQFDEASRVYAAPLQLKANNGLLIIDDFGRQVMEPRELLNRWIVPLDRRVDYLSLRHGVKFQIPFELMVVFATNLDPRSLADEAFLRRIHNKIFVPPVEPEVFDEIFARVVEEAGLECEPGAAAWLRALCLASGAAELRACYPRDICDIARWIGRYENQPPRLTRQVMERAARLYFTQTVAVSPSQEV